MLLISTFSTITIIRNYYYCYIIMMILLLLLLYTGASTLFPIIAVYIGQCVHTECSKEYEDTSSSHCTRKEKQVLIILITIILYSMAEKGMKTR